MGGHAESGSEAASARRPVLAEAADQRVAARHTLLIRSAKLIIGEVEYLCVLRDASESGVSLRLFHPIRATTRMALELQNQERHAVELVWYNEDKMGLRFCERTDIARLIELPEPYSRRPIRVRVKTPGAIACGDDNTMCTILDLSQSGAKLSTHRSFALDQRLRLIATGMPKVQGRVRWRRDNRLGLAFETTFQLSELATIVAGFNEDAVRLEANEAPSSTSVARPRAAI